MAMRWGEPATFLMHCGIHVYHAYKDEYEDVPLTYWYSTSAVASPGSDYEFDVRTLPDYQETSRTDELARHRDVIVAAIDSGLPLAPAHGDSGA